MKKTSLVISSVSAIALSLTGCSGSGSNNSTKTGTGTGSYVDSAVKGAKYICGSQTGTTDKDGNFTFEKGKGCTFELAGITLRKVPADNLVDNAKIVENNLTVARFLQSLDNDGNATNGIQITAETLTVLSQAFQEDNITTVPNDTTKLDTVVNHIEAKDDYFHGHIVTEEEAQNHLHSTQKSVTKNLLAGKTFYVVGSEDAVIKIFKFVVSADGTKFKQYNLNSQSPTDSDAITYNGHQVKIGPDSGYTILTQRDGYILAKDYRDNGTLDNGIPHRLYSSQNDAQKYFNALNGKHSGDNNNSLSAESLKAYFSGKTFYEKCDGNISKMIFNSDGTTLQDDSEKWDGNISKMISNLDETTLQDHIKKWDISFEDGKIVDNDGDHFIDKITDTYVKGHDKDDSFTLYISKSDAEAAANESCGDNANDNGKNNGNDNAKDNSKDNDNNNSNSNSNSKDDNNNSKDNGKG